MKAKLMTMLLAAGALSASADTWTDPDTGIVWNYTVSGGKAQVGIGGYNGTNIDESMPLQKAIDMSSI